MRIHLLAAVLVACAGIAPATAQPLPGPVKSDPEHGPILSPTGLAGYLVASCNVAVVASSPYSGTAYVVAEVAVAGPVAATSITCYVAGGEMLVVTASEEGSVATATATDVGPVTRGVCMVGTVRFIDGSEVPYGSRLNCGQ